MEQVAIFAALRWECMPIVRRLRQVTRRHVAGLTVWRGAAGERCVWVVKTGIGPTRAAAAVYAINASERFSLFVSTGCAGALAPELVAGDLAIATSVVGDSAGDGMETDVRYREAVCRVAGTVAQRACVGPVLCSPRVLATIAEKRAAAARGNVAVEMEGAPIAACAAQAGVPFVSVRAILDTAETELPHAGRFIDPQSGAMKPLALAGYLAAHPGALSGVLAMQRMRHVAERSLGRFFAAWFADAW